MTQLLLHILLPTTLICLSYVLTGWYRRYAVNHGVIDHANNRSSHIGSVPRGGGIAIVVTSTALLLLSGVMNWLPAKACVAISLSTTLVAIIGLIDDHRPLGRLPRITAHATACTLGLLLLSPLPQIHLLSENVNLNTPLGFLAVILGLCWLVNLYNFMDGIDGIASTEAITTLLSAAAILLYHGSELAFPLALLSAPVAGFLIWNWAPAKIFMGDGSSGYLGLLLGLLALYTSKTTELNLWCWAIMLSTFIVDATWTLMIRVGSGQRWLDAHRSHAYQILSRQSSHAAVTLGIAAINLLWLLPLAFTATLFPQWGIALTTLAFTPLALICYRVKAGREN